jgi:AsmA protein
MRKKLLIILLCCLGAFGMASGAAVWWASSYMRTPEFRHELARLIQAATGREARLDGELGLSFFPWFGLKAQGFSLGNDPSFGQTPLLTAREVGARIQVLPLFQRRLVFDTVELTDADLILTMNAEGRGNWEGLAEHLRDMEKAQDASGPFFRFVSVRGLRLVDGKARLDDHQHNHSYISTDLDLRTGRIESGKALPFTASCDFSWPRPGLVARVQGTGMLHWSAADAAPLLTETTVKADIGGAFMPSTAPRAALTTAVTLEEGGRHLKLSDARLRILDASVKGEITFYDVTEMFRMEAQLSLDTFSPREVLNAYWPGVIAAGHKGALHTAHGPLNLKADVDQLVFETPGFRLDASTLSGRARMGFDNGTALDFELAADSLDADALISAFTSNLASPPLVVADLPLEYLRTVTGAGRVSAGSLKLAGVAGKDAQVDWQGGSGAHRLQLRPLKAQGGSVSAELSAVFDEGARDPRPLSGPEAPLLGWSGSLVMDDVDARQVSWVNRPGFSTTGTMDLRAKAVAAKAPAQPTVKISQIVRRAVADVQASLGPSVLEWAAEKTQPKAQPTRMNLSSIQAQARFSPAVLGDADWALQLDGGVSAVGTKPLLNLDGRVSGLLRERQGRMTLTGASASGRLKGWFLPRRENEASFSGRGSLDFSSQSLVLQSASLQACGLTLGGAVSGSKMFGDDWTLAGRIRCQDGDPKRVLAALDIDAPRSADKRVLQRLSGQADLVLTAKAASLANLSGQLDDMPLRGSYSVQNFSAPRHVVNLTGGNFDLDRYLPPPAPVRRGGPAEPPTYDPLPVDELRELDLNAVVSLRGFKLLGITTRDFRASARAQGGSLLVKPLSGNFYGGSISGEFSAQVAGNALQTRLAIAAKDFQAGPFMLGWTGKELVTGHADLFLDVTGQGPTDHDLLRTLDGLGSFRITDGSYVLSGAADGQGGAQNAPKTPPGATPQYTPVRRPGAPFSLASAKLKVNQGVFRSEDFRMDTPNMLVTGKGRFSPAEDSINLTLSASMTGMPDVPIKVFGRLTDPEMSIPPGALITNTIRGILGLPLKPIKFFKDLLF